MLQDPDDLLTGPDHEEIVRSASVLEKDAVLRGPSIFYSYA